MISREEAISILYKAARSDFQYWCYFEDEHYNYETDSIPTFDELFRAIGITTKEIHAIIK